jgi:FkbM family methyltransferase
MWLSGFKRKLSITPSPFPIPVDGMWFIGALPQHIKHGYDEKSTIAYIRRHVKPGDRFVDIGANYGYFTVLAGKQGATVETYEPDDTSFRRAKWNVWINGLSSKVVVHNLAVSDRSGIATFFQIKPGSGNNSMVSWLDKPTKKVKVTTVPYTGHYDLCKIDVEGVELQVLKGLAHRGKAIVEFCLPLLNSTSIKASMFLKEVRSMGWDIYDMNEQKTTDEELIAAAESSYYKTINLLLIPHQTV